MVWEDFPVVMRYSVKSYIKEWGKALFPGEEFKELGRDIDESIEAIKHLAKCGYDGFNVDADPMIHGIGASPMYQKKGLDAVIRICKKAVIKQSHSRSHGCS